MRICKYCGALMSYNREERKWECACGEIIDAVTMHGERVVQDDFGNVAMEEII